MSSNQDLRALEPKALFNHFANMLEIPHPSGKEEGIAAYLLKFAADHGFECRRNDAGDVIMKIPATQGRESSPRVILQGHMDMVPVAAEGVAHDFTSDPISAHIEDGWIKTHGTTLGADDALGECTALALIEDPTLSHGPITAIFTVEEETTMKGAINITAEDLEGEYLINLDSEENGFITVSCAGSCNVDMTFPVERIQAPDTVAFKVRIKNFSGGHSGTDIHKNHANAIQSLAFMLCEAQQRSEIFIEELNAGQVRNAIPSEAEAAVRVPAMHVEEFKEDVNRAFAAIKDLYKETDPAATLELSACDSDQAVLCLEDSEILLNLLNALPTGPQRMWPANLEIVETSCNLGLVHSFEDRVEIGCMPRSLNELGLDHIIARLKSAGELSGCEVALSCRHPCWSSPYKNRLIDVMQQSYREVAGKDFIVTAIHAGLECAQFARIQPKLQLISVGSTILSPHSPKERAEIAGAAELFRVLRLTLEQL